MHGSDVGQRANAAFLLHLLCTMHADDVMAELMLFNQPYFGLCACDVRVWAHVFAAFETALFPGKARSISARLSSRTVWHTQTHTHIHKRGKKSEENVFIYRVLNENDYGFYDIFRLAAADDKSAWKFLQEREWLSCESDIHFSFRLRPAANLSFDFGEGNAGNREKKTDCVIARYPLTHRHTHTHIYPSFGGWRFTANGNFSWMKMRRGTWERVTLIPICEWRHSTAPKYSIFMSFSWPGKRFLPMCWPFATSFSLWRLEVVRLSIFIFFQADRIRRMLNLPSISMKIRSRQIVIRGMRTRTQSSVLFAHGFQYMNRTHLSTLTLPPPLSLYFSLYLAHSFACSRPLAG